jgi:hypothetical protein
MFVFPCRLLVGDFSVIHPASLAGGAARTPGFAAAAWEALLKASRHAYWQVSYALPFVPMSVEYFRRHGAPGLILLVDLADQGVQAGGPGLSRDPSSRGRSGSLALPCAGATCPGGGRART